MYRLLSAHLQATLLGKDRTRPPPGEKTSSRGRDRPTCGTDCERIAQHEKNKYKLDKSRKKRSGLSNHIVFAPKQNIAKAGVRRGGVNKKRGEKKKISGSALANCDEAV